MAVLKINYPIASYKQLLAGELPLDVFFTGILKGEAYKKIIEHLTWYHSQNGDICQINDFELSKSSWLNDDKSGTVIISYFIQYHYGCADITRQAKDHETWKFELFAPNSTLLLYMPEYDVRSTADEF